MSIKWEDFKDNIPHTARIKGKTSYEVVWVNDFPDGQTAGETRFDPKQIAIKNGQSNKESVLTYLHELLHAISHEYEVGLTETQVRKLEKALPVVLAPGNLFVKKRKKK